MKQQQTLAFASAYFILRMSPYKHHEAPDSAQLNPALKKELVRLYDVQEHYAEGKGVYLHCQAMGEVVHSAAIIAGHLLPHKLAGSATMSACIFLLG